MVWGVSASVPRVPEYRVFTSSHPVARCKYLHPVRRDVDGRARLRGAYIRWSECAMMYCVVASKPDTLPALLLDAFAVLTKMAEPACVGCRMFVLGHP